MCWHNWKNWTAKCNNWDGFTETRICLKCWKHQQRIANNKWYNMGYLDPIKDKAWIDNIKCIYSDYFYLKEL